MPTYTFNRTREQARDLILRKLGVLGIGAIPSAEDTEVVYEAMDLRLKELHAMGVLWWQVASATVDLAIVSGAATATVATADFLYPISIAVRSGTEDHELQMVGHRTYHATVDKGQTGEPEYAYFNGSTVRFYPTPDTNYTAKLTYQAIAADTEANTAPDVRAEAMRAFVALVASDLVDDFSIPEPKAQRLAIGAVGALRTMRMLNRERVDSLPVEVDYF